MLWVDPEPRHHTSWSEIDTWSICRQRWYWKYGRNVEPRDSARTPTVGSCGHEAIAAIYRGQCWKKAINRWLATELETRKLFDDEIEKYYEVAETVSQIVPRYLRQYPMEQFKPVLVEQAFEVPIARSRIRLVGFWDAVVQDSEDNLWLMETKFPQQQFRSEEDIELDGQIGIYQWAAHKLGYPVVGIIYNQILGKPPKRPTLNKNGTMSRSDLRCDWETYREELLRHNLDPADYGDMQEKLSQKEFFRRYFKYRGPAEIKLFVEDLQHRVWDLSRRRKHLYMSENRINCGACPYRELCLEKLKGGDVEYAIKTQYAPRRSRRLQEEPDIEETLVELVRP